MKLPEHLGLSYLLAQLGPQQTFGPGGTTLVILAGVLPDLDGLSILGGWKCHRTYHRKVGHGLPLTLLGPLALAVIGWACFGLGPLLPLWLWLQLSLLIHLLTDVLFYRWPVQLLWPFSDRGLGLGLVGWNDLVPTLLLYGGTAACWLGPPAVVAAAALSALALYVLARAVLPRPRGGWYAWLAGNWARRSPPVYRWLTGDFIP